MNNFMNQYNAEMNRIQQAYNQEMQNLQNSLSQYRQQQFLPPVQPSQQQEQGTPINVQILATLGDIKGILMKIAPKEEEPEKTKEKQPAKKE